MVTDSRGRKSGVAYVQFTSQEAADEALQRDREIIGSRLEASPTLDSPGCFSGDQEEVRSFIFHHVCCFVCCF